MSLYPETEARWWSRSDHEHVVQTVRRLRARTVLEFGPGTSTLALIEGGATHIDCCEDDDYWFKKWCEAVEDVYPDIVTMKPYRWTPEIYVAGLCDSYDMALIDGPLHTEKRIAVLDYAAARCRYVLVPLESQEGLMLMTNAVMAYTGRRFIEIRETGPVAGSFALMGPRGEWGGV